MARREGRWVDILRDAREEAKGFPRLTKDLRTQIAHIRRSPHGYPCLATLKDGTERDCVYVAEAYPWFKSWGVWPEDDQAKHSLSLDDIASLRESPTRLPPDIADQIYEAGESGMGYCLFTLRFRDGSEHAFATGNALDFPIFPNGKSPGDIVSVTPHGGRNATSRFDMRPYLWCLYSGDE